MLLVKIVCPKCAGETGFSVSKGAYEGPFRCGQCKEIFKIKIANNEVVSTEAMNPNDAWKIQKLKY